MMKKKFLLIYIITTILIASLVIAPSQPTQTYSQIYLNPFYKTNMKQDTNYTYTLSINPPDGLNEVKSSIISFNIYLVPPVTFNLLINGKSCNNPSFTVDAQHSSSGQGRINFDCKNLINKTGEYNLTIQSSKETGAITGWLELTYTNKPMGTAELSGTEYQIGDVATLFLQLKDNQGLPIDDGVCYLDVYYPYSYNSSHAEMINNAPMTYKEEGIYYYDLIIPDYTGVYMATATCGYVMNNIWVYDPAGTKYPTRNVINGTYTGDTLGLIAKGDLQYQKCEALTTNNSVGYTTNKTIKDPSTNYTTQNNVTSPILSSRNGVTERLNMTDSSIRVAYTFDQDPTTYAVSRYVYDSSINNNALFMGVSNVWNSTGGIIGGAYNWNGLINNYAQALQSQSNGSLNFTSNQFTLSVWVKVKGWTTTGVVVGQYETTTPSGWKLYHTSTNLLTFLFRDNASTAKSVSTGALTTNVWYHIVARLNGTTSAIFVNGTLIASTASTLGMKPVTQDLWVGDTSGATTTDIWNGTIDEITIYNRSLTNSEITALYNKQQPRFYNTGEQTYDNINAIICDINITLEACDQNQNTLLQLSVGNTTGSGYNYNEPMNFTNCTARPTFTGNPNNISIKITWKADNNSYYTPVIYNNMTIANADTSGAYSDQICEATYDFNTTIVNINLLTLTSENLYYAGESTSTNSINFSIWNWTSNTWKKLPNTLTFHATATTTSPSGFSETSSNSISNSSDLFSNQGIMRIKTTSFQYNTSQNFTRYDDQLNIILLTSSGTIQEIKGSSELHVSNTTSSGININITDITETKNLAQQIWDYITNWLNNTINGMNNKLDIIINQTTNTQTIIPMTITATADDCITGSNWIIEAVVRGQYNQILDNNSVSCNLTTIFWGVQPMNYNNGTFTFYDLCPAPSSWNWSIDCS